MVALHALSEQRIAMKRQIQLGLIFMLCCFAFGGTFISKSMSDATNSIEELSLLQKVELLRQNLEIHIQSVQADLRSLPAWQQPAAIETEKHIKDMVKAAEECGLCHQSEHTKSHMDQIRRNVAEYIALIERTRALQGRPGEFKSSKALAFAYGEKLLERIENLSITSPETIAARIDRINGEMIEARNLTFFLIILGPLVIIAASAFFLHRFTASIDTLVAATRKIRPDNLSYRITDPLKNEFKTLADAFNLMIQSLRENRRDLDSLQKLYKTLFESAGEAICIVEPVSENCTRIVSVNKAASEIYGYSIQDLRKMSCSDLSPEAHRTEFNDKLKSIIDGNWIRFQAPRLRKNGSPFTAEISAGPLVLDDKRYVLSFARDITERIQAEQELLRANQMAVAGQMAVGLAHEIKNPLAGIKASVEVLVDDLDLDEADKNLLGRVINEVQRMEKLLKNLLNYARPPQPNFDIADLNRLLEMTINNVEVSAARTHGKQIDLVKDFDTQTMRIEMDSSHLQQVFLNILLNAVDAIKEKGNITVSSRLDSQQAIVTISDTGKGMTSETLNSIFNPFYTTKKKGTGLGLSLSKRLVEQHGGTIEAVSQPDRGSTFTIKVPLTQPHEQG